MKLHCLGTAGYHPNEFRHTSCYFIPEKSMAFDAGTGLFRIAPLVHASHLDVLISHSHLDHIFGLTYFLELVHTTPLKSVSVYGEKEKLDAVRNHLFAELIFPALPNVEWIPIENVQRIGSARVKWIPLVHPGGSIGYRLDWDDHSFAYITDTTALPDSDYWEMVKGVDLLLHECNFLEHQKEFAVYTGHSWPSEVIAGAKKAGVKKLLISHFDPLLPQKDPLQLDTSEASKQGMEIICAEDGAIVPLR